MTSSRVPTLALLASLLLALAACKKAPPPAPDAAVPDAAVLILEAPDAAAASAPDAALDAIDASAHAHAGPAAMPGPCVDPAADAKTHGSGATVASTADLDGDGKPDSIYALAGSGLSKPFAIYVMRGTCGHFVGTLTAGTLTAAKTRSHGLADLAGNIPCAKKCNCTTQDFTAHFNGKSYFQGPITETLKQCAPGQKP